MVVGSATVSPTNSCSRIHSNTAVLSSNALDLAVVVVSSVIFLEDILAFLFAFKVTLVLDVRVFFLRYK